MGGYWGERLEAAEMKKRASQQEEASEEAPERCCTKKGQGAAKLQSEKKIEGFRDALIGGCWQSRKGGLWK